MSTADHMHNVRMALRQITADMRGLNPKTSTFQKLAAKRDTLRTELEQLGAKRVEIR